MGNTPEDGHSSEATTVPTSNAAQDPGYGPEAGTEAPPPYVASSAA